MNISILFYFTFKIILFQPLVRCLPTAKINLSLLCRYLVINLVRNGSLLKKIMYLFWNACSMHCTPISYWTLFQTLFLRSAWFFNDWTARVRVGYWPSYFDYYSYLFLNDAYKNNLLGDSKNFIGYYFIKSFVSFPLMSVVRK